MTQEFEKLGAFYIGREFDQETGRTADRPLLYDSRDLTTHGVIVGMTGSGKTGLGLALLEEAAIDGVPAIAIDPKGDLGNLLLAFPDLRPSDFQPWADAAEAARKGLSVDRFAAQTAEAWRNGLAEWGQDGARIGRFKDSVDLALYTPGHSAGRPLQVLRSFAAPPPELAQDAGALRDRILAAVSGLLGLLGMAADPIQSREHILLSSIFARAWQEGRSLDIAAIIGEIQKPPFDRIGVFDLEAFYPAKERFVLAMALNNLLASPGFSAWMEGEALNVQRLLYTPEGKPRISILSIAHLSEAERMFFVSLLLSEVLAWARAQPGTSSLRALLYMDEIFGYFPPSANPPSKIPMLTLLKQARAYGLGVVLATQNPVDLDYKGLANTGTWWIGRLQTERDKLRVIEGLEGAAAGANAAFDRGKMEQVLAGLGSRVFLMRNVHEQRPVVFRSRWTLCYMRGPMTLPQIRQATAASGAAAIPAPAPAPGPAITPVTQPAPPPAAAPAPRPVLPPELPEYFLRPEKPVAGLSYRAGVLGTGKLHFMDARAGVDTWQTFSLIAPVGEDGFAAWEEAAVHGDLKMVLERNPAPGATFGSVPSAATRKQSAESWRKTLEDHLYQRMTLELWRCRAVELTSQPGETEGDFRIRVVQRQREKRDLEIEKTKARYAPRLQALGDQLRRAQEREAREKAQASQQKLTTVIGVGATLLGALLGRRAVSASSVGRAASTLRSAGRIGKEQEDAARAGESVQILQERLAAMNLEFEKDMRALQEQPDPQAAEIEKVQVRPRKSDITTGAVGLCWSPCQRSGD